MSPWNLSQGLHFGFSTISLTEVSFKHPFVESTCDFCPRCARLGLCLPRCVEEILFIYQTVSGFEFVFTSDPSALSDHWSRSHPSCGFGRERGQPGGTLHCGSAYKGARALNVSERSAIGKKANNEEKKNAFQHKRHQITNQTSAESKHFVNEEDRRYLLCHWAKMAVTTLKLNAKWKSVWAVYRFNAQSAKSAVVLLM